MSARYNVPRTQLLAKMNDPSLDASFIMMLSAAAEALDQIDVQERTIAALLCKIQSLEALVAKPTKNPKNGG